LAKIAVEFEQALARHGATAGRPVARLLAAGEGWTVEDLVCRSGPQDHPFEERHSLVSIAIVLAGTFQYRAANGRRRGRRADDAGLGAARQCWRAF